MVNHFSATGAFSLFCYPINNSYLPPTYANSPMVAEVTNTSNRLVFSDPSNHRNSRVQMAITGLALPFFAGLTFVGVTHGAYLWAFIMAPLYSLLYTDGYGRLSGSYDRLNSTSSLLRTVYVFGTHGTSERTRSIEELIFVAYSLNDQM